MKKRSRLLTAAFSALAALVLSGCSFRLLVSPEELYTLPALPAEYTALESRIRELLSYGMEYAAPLSGTATQNVQLMELGGGEEQEAVVFLRSPTEEQPLRIHIFTPVGDDYVQTAVIAGSGTDIYSFNVQDLNGDGQMELLAGWQTGTRVRALTVYALRDAGPVELLRTGYAKYTVADMDGDGVQELTVFRTDETGRCAADLYVWEDGLKKTSSAALSVTAEELNAGGVHSGRLRDGSPALFVSGVTVYDTYDALMADVLCLREGTLTALTQLEYTGITKEIFRYRDLLPGDINGDGVTEIPAAVMTDAAAEKDGCRVDWYAYGAAGLRHLTVSTYHNFADGWYLELPPAWSGRFSAVRTSFRSDEASVTFSLPGEAGFPFLRISAVTGGSREEKASQEGRIILSRQPDVIYTAQLLADEDTWKEAVSGEELRSRFHLIERVWAAGDN